ncbi:PREDICTED: uncharacterized protein LOC108372678 [Rhagoletis zephyria]|uniref:uncharacterized protein LOC108372678 n=1 Tax=Rhagoletis zephyria TaxID=28612 RepID=UPI0008112118|nr:PREDICTED: uncharacterized protein LOC108372678 [Rhagoletis zephyria]
MEKTLKISNKQQIDSLVDLVEKHPDIGRGKGQYGSSRQETKDTWVQFAVELNSLGPPSRTGPEWQRVSIHYKANLKRKLAKNKENFLATQEANLTASEERVCELTQVNLSINPPGRAFGLAVDLTAEENVTPPATDSPVVIENAVPNETQTTEGKRSRNSITRRAGRNTNSDSANPQKNRKHAA